MQHSNAARRWIRFFPSDWADMCFDTRAFATRANQRARPTLELMGVASERARKRNANVGRPYLPDCSFGSIKKHCRFSMDP